LQRFLWYNKTMKSLDKLDPLDLDSATKIQVAAIVRSLLEQVERDAQSLSVKDAQIQAKDVKIEALTHELAYLRRIRFGVKSEAMLSPTQRDVFEETLSADLAAIETEIEQLDVQQPGDTTTQPKRPGPGPGRPPLCRAPKSATNLKTASAKNAATPPCWSKSAATAWMQEVEHQK
jgi:hypothetical protein